MVMEQMRFGKPLSQFDADRRKNHLFGEYQPPLSVLADIAGFEIDEWTDAGGVAAARQDMTIAAGGIKAGTAAAQRIIIYGRSGGVDRAPLAEFVAVNEFARIGTFLEMQNWQQYTEMLTQRASATDSFQTTVRRISESDALVYFEIEERHFRGGNVNVVNSTTVFEFNPGGKPPH